MAELRLDEIGYWSEVKLDIVRKYAAAYSVVLANQRGLHRIYIDAFAGAGVHISRATGDYVPGSPLNALNVDPSFNEYHFVDLDGGRAQSLRELAEDRSDVSVYEGDCNQILLEQVFPRARWDEFGRALCLLDPYGLDLDWTLIDTAGKMRSIEIFLNFPIMAMNRSVLRRNPDEVDQKQIARMSRFWGDESWREVAYAKVPNLFGDSDEKVSNDVIVQAYRARLKEVAGFDYVPDPLPMRNSKGAVVYYLYFASPNKTGGKIVSEIFSKYRDKGAL